MGFLDQIYISAPILGAITAFMVILTSSYRATKHTHIPMLN